MTRIPLKTKELTIYAKKEEVVRLEGNGSSTDFHLRDGKKLTLSRSLGHWLKVLEPLGKFIRIHNSHAVNKHDLYAVGSNYVVLRDEERTELPLTRGYKDAIKSAMEQGTDKPDS